MATFRTRARTVDMLGRQQIAGASTAISEIFKNAHDAYAENVEVDHFRTDGLIVIRDDGFGMTKKEFEDKWLVLGTDSKVSDFTSESKYVPQGKKARAIMGEKGIGRLAIAILGRQVLVLTRAKRDDTLHELVLCYLHWGLFEIPGINLEDIEIPIKTYKGGVIPDGTSVQQVLSAYKRSIQAISCPQNQAQITSILNDLERFQIDPEDIDQFIKGLSLKGDGHGTHFYIAPATETIALDIDRERRAQNKDFTKFLLGFCNSTFVDKNPPPIKTRFRDWINEDSPEELIENGEFFTTEELEEADHHVMGRIDEFGQFRGRVRAYDLEQNDHIISWRDGAGKPTKCGPFKIEFGYVQGNQRETMMPPEEWRRMTDKMNSIGGLYIYRDRIRMLPYGNPDFDWAKIEERRTRSAGYYFFSNRRMFGAICLTNEQNHSLHEKAGREGFQEDRAYRQLKSIIENLFVQLAADFFREGQSEAADAVATKRRELEAKELMRRRREKAVSTKKKRLSDELSVFFSRLENGLPPSEIDELRTLTESRMKSAAKMENPDAAAEALLEAEQIAYSQLDKIREGYRIKKPRGVGLSRQLSREWDAYSTEVTRLESDYFTPFAQEIAQNLGLVAAEAKLLVDQRKRVQTLLDRLTKDNLASVRERKKEVNNKADETSRKALQTASSALEEFKRVVGEVNEDFSQQDFSRMEVKEIEDLRSRLETRISEVGSRNINRLSSVRDMLANVADNIRDNSELNQLDVLETIESDLEGLKEQSDLDAELVQLGLAVAIINHEFEASIKSIRRSLRDLHDWARANNELEPLYSAIRNNFEHLDGHLNLFTPLQRRLYRKPVEISGRDIYHYTITLFETRLKRHEVAIKPSTEFLNSKVIGYPSSIYPVFVNLIDNAIYWLQSRPSDRLIRFHANAKSYIISNNGPSVHERDAEAVFEQGFSRKPGGRGLGLFITRKALRKEGMDLVLDSGRPSDTVTFNIIWPKKATDENR